jgi:hypothetical protein
MLAARASPHARSPVDPLSTAAPLPGFARRAIFDTLRHARIARRNALEAGLLGLG